MSYIYEEIKARKERERQNQPIDFTGSSLSAAEIIAFRNNETYRMNNGCYPDRPFAPGGGTYSTGRRY